MTDPWAVLGLAPGSSWDDVRAAHRRLAKTLHPDLRGGDSRRMAEVNRAFQVLGDRRNDEPFAEATTAAATTAAATTAAATTAATAVDELSFSIDQLPVDAFQSVLIVASFLGDPWVIDEPYQLVARLDPPLSCRCLIDLAPEAGGSLVSLTLEPLKRFPFPDPVAVRDAFVAELQQLGT